MRFLRLLTYILNSDDEKRYLMTSECLADIEVRQKRIQKGNAPWQVYERNKLQVGY